MNKIDYENYMVYPFTLAHIQKKYSAKVFEKYADQLCFLYQNGYDLKGNTSLESIDEQMWLFNNFETYDDFRDLQKTSTASKGQPVIGLKIVDSVFYDVLKGTAWGTKEMVNIKAMGDFYREDMFQTCENLAGLFASKDLEIVSALEFLNCDEIAELLNVCLEEYEKGRNNVLLIKYQKMYDKILRKHWDITKKFLSTNDKGLIVRMGNINDQMYGKVGYFDPRNGNIRALAGSAVSNLSRLLNEDMNDDLLARMRLIAKECKDNGETDKTVLGFLKGNFGDKLDEVRKVLAEITFKGIMTLATLKYGITLVDNDDQNSERAGRMMKEIKSICDYTGFYFSEVA